jgi:hypothetical protein
MRPVTPFMMIPTFIASPYACGQLVRTATGA